MCRKYGISEPTFYNWKAKYAGMTGSEARRLKELELEKRPAKPIENAYREKFLLMRRPGDQLMPTLNLRRASCESSFWETAICRRLVRNSPTANGTRDRSGRLHVSLSARAVVPYDGEGSRGTRPADVHSYLLLSNLTRRLMASGKLRLPITYRLN